MQTTTGRVLSVADGCAQIEIDAAVACERCAAGKGCGAGLFGQTKGARQVSAGIAPGVTVTTGDVVRLSLLPARLLRAAGIVYGVPLAGALVAAGAAGLAGLGELGAALAALTGLAVGYFLAKSFVQREACLREFTPLVTAHISSAA